MKRKNTFAGQEGKVMKRKNTFTLSAAMDAARASASLFQEIYIVFLDSGLKWRAQRLDRDTHVAHAMIWPDGHTETSWAETTAGDLRQKRGAA